MRPGRPYLAWRFAQSIRSLRRFLRGLARSLRYGRVPAGGWGHGWRVLIFRYGDDPREELHVLAPVSGYEFDWETLRIHVRGEPWPEYRHEPGKKTGVMDWAGHHLYVTPEGDRPQRVSMDKLVPGAFRGGVDRTLLLIAVRNAGF